MPILRGAAATEERRGGINSETTTTTKTAKQMEQTVNTAAGAVKVEQTAPDTISITLSASEQHPGLVAVVVTNEGSGDKVRLSWVK